jgi:hypothetical protein
VTTPIPNTPSSEFRDAGGEAALGDIDRAFAQTGLAALRVPGEVDAVVDALSGRGASLPRPLFSMLAARIGERGWSDATVPLARPEPMALGPDHLLPPRHERHGVTQLLKLAAGRVWSEHSNADLGIERETVERAFAVGNRLADAVARHAVEDLPALMRLTDRLAPPWHGYYAFVTEVGVRSMVEGMGVTGTTVRGRPAAAILACALLREGAAPLETVATILRRRDARARYGLTFLDTPGRFEPSSFPAGCEPPEGIAEHMRHCAGLPYVMAALRCALG